MIRKMTAEDLPQVMAVENESFPDSPWPQKEFLYELNENPFAILSVYEEDGRILGYIDLWIMYDQAQIANIAVASEARQRGIGQQLMNDAVRRSIENECEFLSLEVRVSNTPARSLYEKNGFIQAAVRKQYYENGEDAYLMIKPVGGLNNDSIACD